MTDLVVTATKIVPVILSGGSGTRLWPLSREHFPKQLLALVGEKTLLQQTALRLQGMTEVQTPMVVCNEEHRFLVAEQMRQIDVSPAAILLEPVGRNTAPALTLAALKLQERDPNALMLVMPADHVIQNQNAFQAAVREGALLAAKEYLVTFGILPTKPETGYGYIRRGEALSVSGAYKVNAFFEKPDTSTAQKYLDSGDYFWNSGIFLMTVARWMAELESSRLDIVNACRESILKGKSDLDFFRIDKAAFAICPSDSIDYAVMEKTEHAAIVPLDAGWSDVGAWSSLWEVSTQDERGNVVQGDVIAYDNQRSLLIAEHRCLAALGLTDLIVVETADAVLVAHKNQVQQVKQVVAELKKKNRTEHVAHRRVYRPWGYYEGIDRGERFQVKRITVNPKAALSLQMHHHRAEHWIVVKGTARVTRGEEVFSVSENESTYIPLGTKHRLENPGVIPLEIIEVQSGSYLGEDDIVRFEDRYSRDHSA